MIDEIKSRLNVWGFYHTMNMRNTDIDVEYNLIHDGPALTVLGKINKSINTFEASTIVLKIKEGLNVSEAAARREGDPS